MSFLSHFPYPFHLQNESRRRNGWSEHNCTFVNVYMYADKGPTPVLSVCLHVYEAICACKQNEMREFWWKRWLCNRLSNHKGWELN